MTAIRDPSASSSTFTNILVVAPFPDLESRVTAEETFVDRLRNVGVRGIPSLTVIPPTAEYTDEELVERLVGSGADAMLLMTVTEAFEQTVEVLPPTSTTTGDASLYGNVINFSATTEHDGGWYASRPNIRTELRLFDLSTGATAWLATSVSRGNAVADFGDLVGSLANTAAEQLQKDGLLAR
jgi:hypothetical protein